jgi:HNH endonuclease
MNKELCSIEGCLNPAKSKGWCGKHYSRWFSHGDPTFTLINTDYKPKCKISDCFNNSAGRKGYCRIHLQRLRRYGRVENILAPKGEGHINDQGYKLITINGIAIREHVFLAEKALGRPLPKGVIVHHLNEDKLDNYTALNLIICPDVAYHKLLHKRGRELGLYISERQGQKYRGEYTSDFLRVAKHGNKFSAVLCHDNKRIYLGVFDTEEEASRVYKEALQNLNNNSVKEIEL